MGQQFPNVRPGIQISAGTGLAQTGTVVFSNSNGFSFGMQFSASSYVITAAGDGVAISAGTSVVNTGTVVFSNSNGVSFGLSGSTVTASTGSNVSYFEPSGERNVVIPFGNGGSGGGSLFSIQRFSIPYGLSVTQVDVIRHLTVAGSTANSYSFQYGFYTFSGSTASVVSSFVLNVTFNSGSNTSAASIYGGNSGTRFRSASIAGPATFNFTPGEYLFAFGGSFSGVAGTTGSISVFGRSSISIAGAVGGGNYSQYFGDGIFSTTPNQIPTSIHLSAITQTGATAVAQPYFRLIGV